MSVVYVQSRVSSHSVSGSRYNFSVCSWSMYNLGSPHSVLVSRSTLSLCSWSMYNLGSLVSQCWSVVLPSLCVPGLCTISIVLFLSISELFYHLFLVYVQFRLFSLSVLVVLPSRCIRGLCTISGLFSRLVRLTNTE